MYNSSEALHVNLSDLDLGTIQTLFSFKWSTQSLPYLGIKLTSDIANLYLVNYTPLYDSIKRDLKNSKHRHFLEWVE